MSRADILANTRPSKQVAGFGDLVDSWVLYLDRNRATAEENAFLRTRERITSTALEILQKEFPEVATSESALDALVLGSLMTARDVRQQRASAQEEDMDV